MLTTTRFIMEGVRYVKTQLSFILLIMLTTTCSGHCGPSSCQKMYIQENYTECDHSIGAYSKLSTRSLFRFLWPKNGPQWPKHVVVSIINKIQDSCVLTYPTHYLIAYSTAGMIHLQITVSSILAPKLQERNWAPVINREMLMLAEDLEQASWNVNHLVKIFPNFMWKVVSLPYWQESGRPTCP